MRLSGKTAVVFVSVIFPLVAGVCRGAIALDALGLYLTKNGYGGAQVVHLGNYYHLPIQSNGKPGNFLIDTGSPPTLIFRTSLNRLNLVESKTTEHVIGAYGRGRDVYGLTTIKTLTAGNCILTNVPVAVASGLTNPLFSRTRPDGLLGLRELIKFGAVLDLGNHLLYLRPSRPGQNIGTQIKSILSRQGYTTVPLLLKDHHVFVAGAVNGVPCNLVVDTGSYLTTIESKFAARAKLSVAATPLLSEGLGGSSAVGITTFPSLRIGNYEIKNGSASVELLDPQVFRSNSGIAGFIGAEYLAINRAIFDFVSGTLYLRPPSH